jgi:hypothetical protein
VQLRAESRQIGLITPQVPVHLGRRHFGWQLWARTGAGEIRTFHNRYLADRAVTHQIAPEVVDGDRSLLSSDLEDGSVLLFRANQMLPFCDRQGEWFLRVDIKTGLHGMDARQYAGVRRRGHEHAIEFLAGNHLPVVLILRALPIDKWACGLADRLEVFGNPPTIAVGHSHQA